MITLAAPYYLPRRKLQAPRRVSMPKLSEPRRAKVAPSGGSALANEGIRR
jgi:hypothetical protein